MLFIFKSCHWTFIQKWHFHIFTCHCGISVLSNMMKFTSWGFSIEIWATSKTKISTIVLARNMYVIISKKEKKSKPYHPPDWKADAKSVFGLQQYILSILCLCMHRRVHTYQKITLGKCVLYPLLIYTTILGSLYMCGINCMKLSDGS